MHYHFPIPAGGLNSLQMNLHTFSSSSTIILSTSSQNVTKEMKGGSPQEEEGWSAAYLT